MVEKLEQSLYELIARCSTLMPSDLSCELAKANEEYSQDSVSGPVMDIICANTIMAAQNRGPICQDTGMPSFYFELPGNIDIDLVKDVTQDAIARATSHGLLRPNSVDSLSGRNSGNNLGPGTPRFHFSQTADTNIRVKLMLKGGGCENVGAQYALPCELEHLGTASRNLEGVRKCVLHALWKAQGLGCAPGIVGVCVGSDRAGGYDIAKEQLLHTLDETNPDSELAALEKRIIEEANTLGVGPMGFGSGTTLLGCRIAAANRVPASFFVSIAYSCWATRRKEVLISAADGSIVSWGDDGALLEIENLASRSKESGIKETSRIVKITTPVSEEDIRSLRVGDIVSLDGIIFTGRDAVHSRLIDSDPPFDLRGGVIYHCGPIIVEDENRVRKVKAAGPTTSAREELYQGRVLEKTGARIVIGKGGMGPKTQAALKRLGAVYLSAVGGAAQYYSDCIREVVDVGWEELGVPEAMWKLRVEGFSAVCTMDATGASLHSKVIDSSAAALEKLRDKQ